jgi:hypothetical protein
MLWMPRSIGGINCPKPLSGAEAHLKWQDARAAAQLGGALRDAGPAVC